MRQLRPAGLLVVVSLLLAAAVAAAQPRQALARASAAYYAALVASAHGSIDATNRQLLLLASRWDAALREARALTPPALAKDPSWTAALERAATLLAKARDRARVRDIAGAHGDLEEMRLILHEVRERHGLWAFDDHLAEYHEAVERVTGHISGPSEINFGPRDYADIDEDLRAAQASWAAIGKGAGALRHDPAWEEAARATAAALQQVSRALAAKDRDGLAKSAELLHDTYFDLLSAIVKARS